MESTPTYDVIVIGAGAAGCFAAKELTEGGLTVLLLDAGPDIQAEVDFSMPPADRGLIDRLLLAASGQHVQARCLPVNRGTSRFYVNDKENPYTTPPDARFNWFRGRQVGGRLHTWGRVVPRFSDWELQPSRHSGHGTDWPIAYDDLAPFYDRVEEFLGVHGTREGIPHMPDGRYIAARPMSALEAHVRDEIVSRWPGRRFVPARVVRHNPRRTPTPLTAALRTGRLSVRSNAAVSRIRVAEDRAAARGVSFVDRSTMRQVDVDARTVVLCASAIETVRILLNSTSPRFPGGIGNSSGLLGRHLMDHCMVTIEGVVPEALARRFASPAPEAQNDAYDFASHYLYMPGFRNISEPKAGFTGSYGVIGSVGRVNRRFAFVGLGEMLPYAENRVQLDRGVHDACGIPVARIECRHLANERALIADMRNSISQMVTAAGLEVRPLFGASPRGLRAAVHRRLSTWIMTSYDAYHPGAAMHELGGARMGDDVTRSVVNAFNQCWDVRNVFVTDGACFVSSGYQNTTLTIMALTVRACTFIIGRYRAGEL